MSEAPPRPRAPRARPGPSRRRAALGTAAIAVLAAGVGVAAPAAQAGTATASVIVRATPGHLDAAKARVRRLGGTPVRDLRLINGFAARVPARAVRRLHRSWNVASVTRNAPVRLLASTFDPVTDGGSSVNVTTVTGAQAFWRAGFTGRGVDVALIDSGVVPVDGLDGADKVVNGPDLSFESQAAGREHLDTFGHGTHMAGLIAGRSDAVGGAYPDNPGRFLGMAPDARLVSVKVADAHGQTDVTQIIAALDWIVQHRRDAGLNIRVVNLSYGTDSVQPYGQDPLAFAAEQAWQAGIVVVASAGNSGYRERTGTMTNPGYDPNILTVGAADTRGTLDKRDDTVPSFSSTGSVGGKKHDLSRVPDLIAPGKSVVSLRDPGSFVDITYGVTGGVSDTLFRGSGTSQAAAVVSGAAALVLQQRPSLTPDQVKSLLMTTAFHLSDALGPWYQGNGELDLGKALRAKVPDLGKDQTRASLGDGTLEAARGSYHLIGDTGVPLVGEQDIFGQPFDSVKMAGLEAAGRAWDGGTWNGSDWTGESFVGSLTDGSWASRSWHSRSWAGNAWDSRSWASRSWADAAWDSRSWASRSWADSGWDSRSWASRSWAGDGWN